MPQLSIIFMMFIIMGHQVFNGNLLVKIGDKIYNSLSPKDKNTIMTNQMKRNKVKIILGVSIILFLGIIIGLIIEYLINKWIYKKKSIKKYPRKSIKNWEIL
jgi:tetrahydromethanopterin S-methyltransferase subunit B